MKLLKITFALATIILAVCGAVLSDEHRPKEAKQFLIFAGVAAACLYATPCRFASQADPSTKEKEELQ
jgi:hypothetical protein